MTPERPSSALAYERTNRKMLRKMVLLTMLVKNGAGIREWHHLLHGLRSLIDDVLSYELPDAIVVQVDNPLDPWVEDLLTEAHETPIPDTLPEGW